MRAFLYFFSIFVNVIALCIAFDELQTALDVCRKEEGLPDTMTGPPNFQDQHVKCFFACVMKRVGNMVNGKISLEGEERYFAKYIPQADKKLMAKVKECIAIANKLSDECEVGAAMAKCMINA